MRTVTIDEQRKLTASVGRMLMGMMDKFDMDLNFIVIMLDQGTHLPDGKPWVASSVASNLDGDIVPKVLRKLADSIEEEAAAGPKQ